jgi:hypothetical protein
MTSKTFLNYLKFSGVWVSFALNPYHWRLSFGVQKPDEMDPAQYYAFLTVGPFSIRAVLDDGSW